MSGAAARSAGISLRAGGVVFTSWTGGEIVRDLREISGSFAFECNDQARDSLALGGEAAPLLRRLVPGLAVEIAIDGEPVMTGFIDEVRLEETGDSLRAAISGRDASADLVDCSANPAGPAEYRGLDLTAFAAALCAPFAIAVRADVDVGDSFHVLALDACETVLSAIEKAARQRAVLVTSDGLGGLVLTRAGTTRAPAPILRPGNVHHTSACLSWRDRFSDFYVKGQTRNALRGTAPSLDATVVPFGATPPAPPAAGVRTAVERSAITMIGHAVDPAIDRWRPKVWLAKTQSGGGAAVQNASAADDRTAGFSAARPAGRHGRRPAARAAVAAAGDVSPWTLQDQAEWRRRTQTANAEQRDYVVAGWRDGAARMLWRPNQMAWVRDAYTGLDADRLIAGVSYLWGADGARTKLRVVHPDAYDLRGDAEEGRGAGRRAGRHARATDATARRGR